MSDSTDEDDVRFARSQQIEIVESEGESLGSRGDCGGEENVKEDEVGAADESMEKVAVNSICYEIYARGDSATEGRLQSCWLWRVGYGRQQLGPCAACLDNDANCADDDASSIQSSGSNARHDLDYLHDQPGGLLSCLLMAS